MPKALSLSLRQQLFALHQAGLGAPQIAQQLSLSARTVRHLLRRWRLAPEPQAVDLKPLFQHSGRLLDPSRQAVYQSCLQLRTLHPGWGAGRIRLELLGLYSRFAVPPTRTLQRWLLGAGLAPPPALQVVGETDHRRATHPHQCWQMDAVECLRLGDGSGACWLRLSDECSGAILWTEPFAHYRWAKVPVAQVQQTLRQAFGRWGCPEALRVDNGIPWGIPGGLPSSLSLWTAGLGVLMHWNDPHRPQQNGVVESTQGTSQRWVEPATCANPEELRRRLWHEDWIQREQYPAINGQSRREAYPGLLHSGRGYSRPWEALVWELPGALRFLGRYRVRRKVSCNAQVSLYHRLIHVGPQHNGEWVYVQLDPETVQWVISDVQGQELRRRPAASFTPEAILNLAVARP
jgi:hypothetical protein